jgi:hypothetical protein
LNIPSFFIALVSCFFLFPYFLFICLFSYSLLCILFACYIIRRPNCETDRWLLYILRYDYVSQVSLSFVRDSQSEHHKILGTLKIFLAQMQFKLDSRLFSIRSIICVAVREMQPPQNICFIVKTFVISRPSTTRLNELISWLHLCINPSRPSGDFM